MECERSENLNHATRSLTSQRKDREISGQKKAEPYYMISAIFSIQITMGIFGENWRLYVMKCLMELFDFSMYEEFQTSRDIFRKDQQMNVLT